MMALREPRMTTLRFLLLGLITIGVVQAAIVEAVPSSALYDDLAIVVVALDPEDHQSALDVPLPLHEPFEIVSRSPSINILDTPWGRRNARMAHSPEAGTLAMLAGGVALLALRRRFAR
jgi:hypothetical protein